MQEDQEEEDQQDDPIDDLSCNEQVVVVHRVVQEYNRYVLLKLDHTCVAWNDVVIDAWLLT